jgi:FkbM family methyltransferase
LKWKFFEQFIANHIGENSFLLKKLVPPEYLYKKNSWRISNRRGIMMKLDISNVVDHEIYFNLYDSSFENFIKTLNRIEIFWDVGANIGWTSLQVKHLFPYAEVYAFEPSSKNRIRLMENMLLNETEVKLIPYGLGDVENSFKLYSVLDNNPGMNRIIKDDLYFPYETIKVLVGTSFWKEKGNMKIDALKIDVEGFELHVLKGIEEIIDEYKPSMFIEVDDKNLKVNGSSAIELLNWLFQKGYKLYDTEADKEITYPFQTVSNHFDVIAK